LDERPIKAVHWEGYPVLLYLIRHAEAEIVGLGGVARDFDRPLTSQGKEQAWALARAFAKRNLLIDAVAASPLVRAYQTSVEFLSILAPGIRPITSDLLAIDKLKPNHLSEFLAHLPPCGNRIPSREEKAVAAIGHLPELCRYLEWLIGAGSGTTHIAKAGVACIQFENGPAKGKGKLHWLITPEWS
jgi:phosphohistidine phosphatase